MQVQGPHRHAAPGVLCTKPEWVAECGKTYANQLVKAVACLRVKHRLLQPLQSMSAVQLDFCLHPMLANPAVIDGSQLC
jgi:hypothetical protein